MPEHPHAHGLHTPASSRQPGGAWRWPPATISMISLVVVALPSAIAPPGRRQRPAHARTWPGRSGDSGSEAAGVLQAVGAPPGAHHPQQKSAGRTASKVEGGGSQDRGSAVGEVLGWGVGMTMGTPALLEDLEAQAYRTLASTSATRAQLRRTAGAGVGDGEFAALVSRVARNIARLLKATTTDFLEKQVGAAELPAFVTQLDTLHRSLREMLDLAQSKGVTRVNAYRVWFDQIADGVDALDSLVETLHLSLNPDFRRIVTDAITEMKPAPDPRDWRSALAKLQA
jgi:hypothetical protein